ncbi:substrate-binding domain-containing protein [Paracoccaceae bacterium GXU_MW_L88]
MKWLLAIVVLFPLPLCAEEITLLSTTTTRDSGLLDVVLEAFTEETGITVKPVIAGTGQALKLGERGDGDLVWVHSRAAEEAFVAAGWATGRYDVMENDFVILGPPEDPAGLAVIPDASAALTHLAETETIFVSRGDESGTHVTEMRLWEDAGITPEGAWYRETGSGMGATLNIARAMGGYTLSDFASWAAFGGRDELKVLVQGDPRLLNSYGIMLVNPARHPHVKAEAGQRFIDWLVGPEGQAVIADFRIGGEPVFRPTAQVPDPSQPANSSSDP